MKVILNCIDKILEKNKGNQKDEIENRLDVEIILEEVN